MSPWDDASGDILVVDDVVDNLKLLSKVLSRHGYEVRAVTSGERALDAVFAMPPDLVLLDVRMPGMDGYEVCRRLKADPLTQNIPILFISALNQMQDIMIGFEVGGVDYITKPFQDDEVLARVQAHLTLHRLRQALQQEIATQDRLIAELDAFAHTVAHDLKSPLQNIANYATLLTWSPAVQGDKEAVSYAEEINHYIRRMADTINGLLLLASARRDQVDLVSIEMSTVLGEVEARLALQIQEKEAIVHTGHIWPVVFGQPQWLVEVWVNLLSNALKYGGRPQADPPQPPVIEVWGEALNEGWARFWVQDNGPGIALEDQAHLFAPFSSKDRSRGSHGLGLSIVQRIIDRLGGQVGVQSTPGQGSAFWFTLPTRPPAEQ